MSNNLKGIVASKNKENVINGKVYLSNYFSEDYNIDDIKGKILVCIRTDYSNLNYLKYFKAIVTEYGGILSHAAIISRELKIPCIVGIKDITKILRPNQNISINLNNGFVVKK